MQHQFAERAQDQEHEDAADPIDQEQTGPRRCKAAAGAEKKAGTDGTTERSFAVAGYGGLCDSPCLRA